MYHTSKINWDTALNKLHVKYEIFAPVGFDADIEYEKVIPEKVPKITYNIPKPITSLRMFFLPVKENVTNDYPIKPRIIMGIPACDLAGLSLLDELYLNGGYIDPKYKEKRDNWILIGTDCYSVQEHCHCTTYGINPFPEKNHDIALSKMNDDMYLSVHTEKGKNFIQELETHIALTELEQVHHMDEKREGTKRKLEEMNALLPDYVKTGELIREAEDGIWEKYANTCVSCGACATICPTCTCFLLIDRPGFQKIRNIDACQFPGFERVAAGEDPLGEKQVRFKNRYFCKYVWKPAKFGSVACTGCGRCIDTCIGNINKNELFVELSKATIPG